VSLIKSFPTYFTHEKAEALAVKLKADDPDWDYRVKHDPEGKKPSAVEVYDETGAFVALI